MPLPRRERRYTVTVELPRCWSGADAGHVITTVNYATDSRHRLRTEAYEYELAVCCIAVALYNILKKMCSSRCRCFTNVRKSPKLWLKLKLKSECKKKKKTDTDKCVYWSRCAYQCADGARGTGTGTTPQRGTYAGYCSS